GRLSAHYASAASFPYPLAKMRRLAATLHDNHDPFPEPLLGEPEDDERTIRNDFAQAPHYFAPSAERGGRLDASDGSVLHARLQHRVAQRRADGRSDGLPGHARHHRHTRSDSADRQPISEAHRCRERGRYDPRSTRGAGAAALEAENAAELDPRLACERGEGRRKDLVG